MRSLGTIILENEKAKKTSEYDKFFAAKLADYDVKSPAELSTEEKKKFFDEVEKEWTKDEPTNEDLAIVEDPGATVTGGVKADNEAQENGGGAGKEIAINKGNGDAASDKIEDEGNKEGEPTTSGDGAAVVNDDQDITASVKESTDAHGSKDINDVNALIKELSDTFGTAREHYNDEGASKSLIAFDKGMKLVISAAALLAKSK